MQIKGVCVEQNCYFIKGAAIVAVIILLGAFFFLRRNSMFMKNAENAAKTISLPKPNLDGTVSIEKAIKSRRSVRNYQDKPLTMEQVSQLLWAAQGITSDDNLRAAPSAGALYPMELYVVVGKVDGLDAGVYKYNCNTHDLLQISLGDKRNELSSASLGQDSVSNGVIDIVICGVYERTGAKYGDRAQRYVHMEAGHIAQNIYLQGVALGLGTVVVGAFDDSSVQEVIGAATDEQPLYVMPVGAI